MQIAQMQMEHIAVRAESSRADNPTATADRLLQATTTAIALPKDRIARHRSDTIAFIRNANKLSTASVTKILQSPYV